MIRANTNTAATKNPPARAFCLLPCDDYRNVCVWEGSSEPASLEYIFEPNSNKSIEHNLGGSFEAHRTRWCRDTDWKFWTIKKKRKYLCSKYGQCASAVEWGKEEGAWQEDNDTHNKVKSDFQVWRRIRNDVLQWKRVALNVEEPDRRFAIPCRLSLWQRYNNYCNNCISTSTFLLLFYTYFSDILVPCKENA